MTDPAATQVFDPSIATEESIFSFDTTDWIDPPIFATDLPETSEESNIRILGEKEYSNSVTPTLWHRYLTHGRSATDGYTFDSLMENIDTEPKAALCAIWYQTNYYLDRQMDLSFKLQQWSQHRAQPYLAKHAFATFQVDTLRKSWKDYSRLMVRSFGHQAETEAQAATKGYQPLQERFSSTWNGEHANHDPRR